MRLFHSILIPAFCISLLGCPEDNTVDPADSTSDLVDVSLETEDINASQDSSEEESDVESETGLDGESSEPKDTVVDGTAEEDTTEVEDSSQTEEDTGDEPNDGFPGDGDSPAGLTPSIDSVEIAATPDWGLGAIVQVSTSIPCDLSVTLAGPEGERVLPKTAVKEEGANKYRVLLLGMLADTEYQISVVAVGSNGSESQPSEISWSTEPLPEGLFAVEWEPTENFVEDESGYIAFSASDVTQGVPQGQKVGYLMILNRNAEVVGYKQWATQQGYARKLPQGGWISLQGKLALSKWNLEGALDLKLEALDTESDSFHHELLPLPDGRIATLGSVLQVIDGYAEGSLDVVGDSVIEVDLEAPSLSILWDTFGSLDPFRVITGFTSTFWANHYAFTSDDPKDWTHGNSIFLTENEASYILSIRNQNMVAQFSRDTGELQWALGTPSPTSEADDTWPWLAVAEGTRLPNQQHAATLTPEGNLMVYDNGNDVDTSYVTEYALNPETLSAELVFIWTDPDAAPPIHSRNGGHAEGLPGNRVMLTHSQLIENPEDNDSRTFPLIQMIRKEGENTVKEWDLAVKHPNPTRSTRIYRAHHLESLYP